MKNPFATLRSKAGEKSKQALNALPGNSSNNSNGGDSSNDQAAGLGTFGGVYTPSILTILGVIMYLRFGWVVGNVGLLGTLLIVTLSTSITLVTSLSISAIATDQHVRVGGAYYMISRSLGIESGGAVGIPLYFALSLSVALYTIGFAESVVNVFPLLNQRDVGLVTTVFVALVAIISAKTAVRVQYFIMAAIVLSLLSLLLGNPIERSEIEMLGAPEHLSEGFWTVFAVFFPAVTGILAGVSMSGDLREPNKAIPRGTLAAVLTGYVVYMGLPIVLAMRADATTLIDNPLIMRDMALWGDAILLGVWGATLSSALGSILGGPRVLQALARDGVLPRWLRWLGRGSGAQDEPKLGTIITLALALVVVYFGELNLIAPVLTMFFLATYSVLNIAAATEQFLGSPSYRPSFHVHWLVSFVGAVACIAVMFLINTAATLVALVIVAGIFVWLQQRSLRAAWGDVRQGIWMAITHTGLMKLRGEADPKNWRPHLLVFSGAPSQRWHLIDFAACLTNYRALLSIATVLTDPSLTPKWLRSIRNATQEYLERRGLRAFLRVVKAADPFSGSENLVETYGLGSLMPNSIVLGDNEQESTRSRYCEMLEHLHQMERNIIILHHNSAKGFGQRQTIDVWWGGLKRNGGLMMTLAYLLSISREWKDARIRVKIVVPDESAAQSAHENLERLIRRMRNRAEVSVHVIVSYGRSFDAILPASSQDADLVFLGMREPNGFDYRAYYETLRRRANPLPSTAFVLAAQDLEFGEIVV